MKISLKTGLALSLFPQYLLVQWLGQQTAWVETYYSQGAYPYISQFFRFLFGWLPFSLGDICYTLLTVLALRYVIVNWLFIKTQTLTFLRNLLMGLFHFVLFLLCFMGIKLLPRTPMGKITARRN
jgi:hypothetical protein